MTSDSLQAARPPQVDVVAMFEMKILFLQNVYGIVETRGAGNHLLKSVVRPPKHGDKENEDFLCDDLRTGVFS